MSVDTEARISKTSEGTNYTPPFAVPMKRSFHAPTPESQRWLDEHPAEAKKAEGYVPKTFIPFGPKHDEATMQMNKARPASPLQPTEQRRITTDAGEPDIRCVSIVSVGLAWSHSEGAKGYDLYLRAGGRSVEFGALEYQIAETLPKLPITKHDRVDVNWVVRYRVLYRGHRNDLISITDCGRFDPAKDNDYREGDVKSIGEAVKDVKQDIDAKHAAHVATRPPTEFDTFDQPGDVAALTDAEQARPELVQKIRTYMAIVNKWADLYSVPPKGRDEFYHTLLDVESFYDWTGTFDEATAQTHRGIMDAYPNIQALRVEIKDLLDVNNLPLGSFQDAVGHPSIEAAQAAGMKPSLIWEKVGSFVLAVRREIEEGKSDTPETEPTAASKSTETEGNTKMPEQTKIGRSSAPETGNPEPIDIKDKIREKYNQPQRGKDYLTVAGRVLIFRVDHPDWSIETDIIAVTETTAVFKAVIKNAEGRVLASGHGRATEAGTKNLGGRFLEKAETAAIGRALAICGYGTDDTLDDADYLADSPVERKTS